MRADGRTGPSPAPDPARGDTEAQAERESAGVSRAELLTRYQRALARVEELHRGLRQLDQTLDEAAGLRAQPRSYSPPDAVAQGAPTAPAAPKAATVPTARDRRAEIAANRRTPPGATNVQPAAAPLPDAAHERVEARGKRVSRAGKWQWAGVAGATLVVAVIAVGALGPAPRPSASRDAPPLEERPPAERVSSRPPADDAVEERAVEETPAPASPPEEHAAEPTLVRHINSAAGYSFRYPDSWTLDESGEVTTVSSANGRYIVSFALGPQGALDETYESFVGLLDRSYREVAVTSRDNVSLSSGPALLVGGQAVNSSGTHVAFRALLVQTAPQSPTIGAIAATDSAAPFDDRLTDVLTSVEAT